MAKEGIDYFSLDVGFLRDKKIKLIKSEFGAKGILILIQVFCSIYEEGYYKRWDEDDCLLMADAVGCGITPDLVTQVVLGCVRRSIFDEKLFNLFGILTSHGIQWRYIRAAYKRDIEIYEEYFLLDVSNKNDVPASSLNKITLKSVVSRKTTDNSRKTTDNSRILKQSKVKKSKVNNIRALEARFENEELNNLFERFINYRSEKFRESLSDDQINLMVCELQKIANTDKARMSILEKAILKGWKNFYPLDEAKKNNTNKFNNFKERDYDYDDLERKLLGTNNARKGDE